MFNRFRLKPKLAYIRNFSGIFDCGDSGSPFLIMRWIEKSLKWGLARLFNPGLRIS